MPHETLSGSTAPAAPIIPDHTLIRKIGIGSYGEVWLARNIVGTARAVKVIYRRAFDHDRPYEREFAGISRFEPISRSHDGFVDILQLGRNNEAGYFYYVMELADDARDQADHSSSTDGYIPRTLRTEMDRRGRLPIPECLKIGAAMSDALVHLHAHGLVHRDVKPSNIIIVGGAPKLADIGLVAGVSEARSYVGTEGFIPPEGPGYPQADLYSLGKVLYEISTGKDRNDFPELPSEFMVDGDRTAFSELNEIILRACVDPPEQRYHCAKQMHGDISALLAGESVRKRHARARLLDRCRTAGLILLSMLVLLGGFHWGGYPGLAIASFAQLALGAAAYLVMTTRSAARAAGPHTAAASGLQPGVPADGAYFRNDVASSDRGRRSPQGVGAKEGVFGSSRTMASLIRGRRALALAVFLAAAAGLGWMTWSITRKPLDFLSRDWILVTDFVNQTGEPIFDRSLWSAFNISLQQSTSANVFPRSRLEETLKRMGKNVDVPIDESIGREICLREDIRGLVAAEIANVGGKYTLSARLVNPQTAISVRAYQVTASERDEVIEALGTIAGRIRRDLGESLASIQKNDRPLPLVTTRSLEALKSFAEGSRLWRRGAYDQAVGMYESAVARDPDFAMAHAALGTAYCSFMIRKPMLGKQHYERALRNEERITDRERLYIRAAFARDLGHIEEASDDYRLYLSIYPDDAAARYIFATMLMLNQRPDAAIEEFKEVVRTAPSYAPAYINLATSYKKLDRPQEALPYYAKAFELERTFLSTATINHEYAFTLVATGNPSKAREVVKLALDNPDLRPSGLRSMALLALYEGKYAEAKEHLQESILLSTAKKDFLKAARGCVFMSILLDGENDPVGRLRTLDEAVRNIDQLPDPQVWLAARIGAGFARSGNPGKAERILHKIQPAVDQKSAEQRSFLHMLEGELALANGSPRRAVGLMLLADREAGTEETLATLAFAYDRSGNRARAIESYEKLIFKISSALGWESQQSWIAAHARLAELYLSAGDRERASVTLARLERMWKNADPNLPLTREIIQLRKRL
jgi:tetratricopeptide (TPR) repeat protein